MIQVNEIAFSSYVVTDMPRARAFYEGVLGLKPTTVIDGESGQFTEYELGPHTLALGVLPGWEPGVNGGSVFLEVEDFDAATAHLRERGVPFKMEPFPTPVCRMAMVLDPDGNAVGIHRRNAR